MFETLRLKPKDSISPQQRLCDASKLLSKHAETTRAVTSIELPAHHNHRFHSRNDSGKYSRKLPGLDAGFDPTVHPIVPLAILRFPKSSTATRFKEITLYLKLTTQNVPSIKTSTRHCLPGWHLRLPIPHPARWILDLTSNTH